MSYRKFRYIQIQNGVKRLLGPLRAVAFMNQAVVCIKNLEEVQDCVDYLKQLEIDVVEITPTILSKKYRFACEDRRLTALRYFELGFGGHAIVKGDLVIGDTWYFDPYKSPGGIRHKDLGWLKIKLPEGSVYTFDIFVAPDDRGNGVSSAFQNSAMHSLRSKGYTAAFGYVFADNIPAMWNTFRVNKWKKVKKVTVCRIFSHTFAVGKAEEMR